MFDPGVAVFNPNDDANNDVSQPVVFATSSCTKDFIEIESSGETCSRLNRLLLILKCMKFPKNAETLVGCAF